MIHWNPDPEIFTLIGKLPIRYYGLLWLIGLALAYLIVQRQYRDRRIPTEKSLLEWATEAADRGAGEILFTSMNHDGVKTGFALEALAMLADRLTIPVIASGGAGSMEHFRDAFTIGHADAALAASVFHFGEIGIPQLKKYLKEEGISVR